MLNSPTIANNIYIKKIIGTLLFFLCPFISFMFALKDPISKYNKMIIVTFFGLLGFIRKLSETGDANSWTNKILLFVDYGIEGGLFFLNEFIYNFGYISFLYLVSFFKYTAIIWCIIFVLTGIILLYIYQLQLPNDKNIRSLSIRGYILFVFYISFIPFTSFGVKFWVALNIFLIGFYCYVNRNNKKGFFILVSSAFFHFTFVYPIFLFTIFYVIRNKIYRKPYFVILIGLLSFPLVYLCFWYLTSEYVGERYDAYSSGSLVEQRALWIQMDRIITSVFSLLALFWILRMKKKTNSESNKSTQLFLSIFAIGLIPLFTTLDGLDRFSRVFSYMVLIFLLKLNIERVKHLHLLHLLSIPVFVYHMLVNFFMRKNELDIDVFWRDITYFLSGDLMTKIIIN